MANDYRYRGNLAKTTLPEILSTINRFKVSGQVEAQQGNTTKTIFLKDGHVFHASSNDPIDRLSGHLKRTGMLADKEIAALSEARSRSKKRFGQLLIERKHLTPFEVYRGIREHIEAIVWSLFYWQEGEISFHAGKADFEPSIRINIPLCQVILQGIKSVVDPRPLVARLGNKETVFHPSCTAEQLIEIGLNAEEYQLLSLVNGKKSLYELCAKGPLKAADNAKLLYAFQVLQFIDKAGADGQRQRAVKVRLKTSGDQFS